MKSNIMTNDSGCSARRSAGSIASYATGDATQLSDLIIESEYRFPYVEVLKMIVGALRVDIGAKASYVRLTQ